MFELVEQYFLHLNCNLPLLHRPTFEAGIRAGLHLRDEGFGATVLLVCAIGARFSQNPAVFHPGARNWHWAGWQWFEPVRERRKLVPLTSARLYDLQVAAVRALCSRLCPRLFIVSAARRGVYRRVGGPACDVRHRGPRPAACARSRRSPSDNISRDTHGGERAQETCLLVCLASPNDDVTELNMPYLGAWSLWIEACALFWADLALFRTKSGYMRYIIARNAYCMPSSYDVDYPIECDDEYWENEDPSLAFKQPPGKASTAQFFTCILRLGRLHAYALRGIVSTRACIVCHSANAALVFAPRSSQNPHRPTVGAAGRLRARLGAEQVGRLDPEPPCAPFPAPAVAALTVPQ